MKIGDAQNRGQNRGRSTFLMVSASCIFVDLSSPREVGTRHGRGIDTACRPFGPFFSGRTVMAVQAGISGASHW